MVQFFDEPSELLAAFRALDESFEVATVEVSPYVRQLFFFHVITLNVFTVGGVGTTPI